VTIGKPRTLEPFEALNADKPYAERIKPFNFLLTAHLPQFVAPPEGEDPQRFQLVAPWEPDASKWLELLGEQVQNRLRNLCTHDRCR